MRPKEGNLAYIAKAQQAGTDTKQAQSIDKSNKQLSTGIVFLQVIYSVLQDI